MRECARVTYDGRKLERGRAAVKDEDGLDTKEEELADAAEEAEQVRVAEEVALAVAHRLQELVQPNARVYEKRAHRVRAGRGQAPRKGRG